MTMLKEIGSELIAMFLADGRMTLEILGLVALSGILVGLATQPPLIGGVILLVGCPVLLIKNVYRAARADAPSVPQTYANLTGALSARRGPGR